MLGKLTRIAILSLLTLVAAVAPSFAELTEWRLDTSHTYVGFKVRHMMVTWVRGRFATVQGKVLYDPADPASAQIEINIDPASIDTNNERRDKDLRGPNFFDVEKYPEMKFVSKKVEEAQAGKLKLIGDLTMHGVTKEVVLDVDGLTEVLKNPRSGDRVGATASARIDRKDWGLTWNRVIEAGGVTVGDEVQLEIEIELAGGGARRSRPAKPSN